jgi:hypothetical protein
MRLQGDGTHATLATNAGEAALARTLVADAFAARLAAAATQEIAAVRRERAVDAAPPVSTSAVPRSEATAVLGVTPLGASRLAAVVSVPAGMACALYGQTVHTRLGGGAGRVRFDWSHEQRRSIRNLDSVAAALGSFFDKRIRADSLAASSRAIKAAPRGVTAAHAGRDAVTSVAAAGGAFGDVASPSAPPCRTLARVRADATSVGTAAAIAHGRIALGTNPPNGASAAIWSEAEAVAARGRTIRQSARGITAIGTAPPSVARAHVGLLAFAVAGAVDAANDLASDA